MKGADATLSSLPMSTPVLNPRDLALFHALQSGPLTVRQLLKISLTFPAPFTSERRLQDRLRILTTAGLLQRWPYATGDRSAVYYYTLPTATCRLLSGDDLRITKAQGAVGISRQHHTRCLADFRVHTLVAARASGIAVTEVYRENALRLDVNDKSLYPDLAFTLISPAGQVLRFFVEMDNGTEPITSPRERDSWQKKLAFYEALQDACGYRFRVLGIVTRSPTRLNHIIATAAAMSRNPQRSLFLGACLEYYLANDGPLENPCFLDHRGQAVPLVAAPRFTPTPPLRVVQTVAPMPALC